MAPIQVPQDIIDEIVHHLRHDTTTLKACSIVSRTFFPPSRRQLFSQIVLNTPISLHRLHQLLKNTPEISKLVCAIHIHAHIISRVSTPILSTVLHQFTRLHHLIIGNDNDYFDWSHISADNAETLEALITSGTLYSLEFICAYHVPTSLIRAASSIKSLRLEVSVLYDDTDTTHLPFTPLANLETLHLSFEVVLGINYWEPFTTPNLHRLSVLGTERQTVDNMQNILQATSSSIQDIIWHEFSLRLSTPRIGTANVDLGILSNLRFLSFVTSDYSYLDVGSSELTWYSIISKLRDPAVIRNLERLSIAIKTSRKIVYNPPSGDLFGLHNTVWEDLDTLLINASCRLKLHQVVFYFDTISCDKVIGERHLYTMMEEKLPDTCKSKLLSIKVYQDLDWTALL